MAGDIDKLLEVYGADADPFAMGPPPPDGYRGYDYQPTLTPLDIARAVVPPPSGASERRDLGDQARGQRANRWREPSLLELLSLAIPAGRAPLPTPRPKPLEGIPTPPVGKTLSREVSWALDPHGEGRLFRPWPDEAPTLTGMSAAQRAAAEAAGYDTSRTLYRGSAKPTSDALGPFKRNAKLDPEEVAAGRESYEFPYFTDRPRIAEHYASGELWDPSPASMVANADKPRRYGPNITPAWALRDKTLVVPYTEGGSRDIDSIARLLPELAGKKAWDVHMETIADAARRKGYNMVEFKGMGDWGGKQSQYLPLHPDAIRSPWANFGPDAKPGSFMGGLAIAAPALAAMLRQYGVDPTEP